MAGEPITFIGPFAAGGGTDAFARPLAAQSTPAGKARADRKPAPRGRHGRASAASKAAPDGYNLHGRGASRHRTGRALNLDYDIEKHFRRGGPGRAAARRWSSSNPDKVARQDAGRVHRAAPARPPWQMNYGSPAPAPCIISPGELFKILTDNIGARAVSRAGPAMQGSHPPAMRLLCRRGWALGRADQGQGSCAPGGGRAEAGSRRSPDPPTRRKRLAWGDEARRPGTGRLRRRRTCRRRSSNACNQGTGGRPCRWPWSMKPGAANRPPTVPDVTLALPSRRWFSGSRALAESGERRGQV